MLLLQVFAVGQSLTFDYIGYNFMLSVTSLMVQRSGEPLEVPRGQLVPSTLCMFEAQPASGLQIAGQAGPSYAAPKLFKDKEFNFEKLGIGGLDNQFEQIFRRAFASRVFPPAVVEKLGIHHVKGVLLYGPPGTGALLVCNSLPCTYATHTAQTVCLVAVTELEQFSPCRTQQAIAYAQACRHHILHTHHWRAHNFE